MDYYAEKVRMIVVGETDCLDTSRNIRGKRASILSLVQRIWGYKDTAFQTLEGT